MKQLKKGEDLERREGCTMDCKCEGAYVLWILAYHKGSFLVGCLQTSSHWFVNLQVTRACLACTGCPCAVVNQSLCCNPVSSTRAGAHLVHTTRGTSSLVSLERIQVCTHQTNSVNQTDAWEGRMICNLLQNSSSPITKEMLTQSQPLPLHTHNG